MRNLLTFAALLSLSVCSCGQSQSPTNVTQIGAASNPVVALLIPSAQIAVGGTFQFVATTVLQDNSNSVPAIGCAWTSSSPGVATINSSGLATGVSVGSSTITCSVGSQMGTALLTVIATPSITSPTCGTPPCSLTGGVNGTAYLYTLTAIGGVLPYTWTCPATCNMPGWMSLNASTGALTGTAATGTSTFTIKVCDSSGSPLCTTLAVTLTVISTAACVPPNYAGPPLYPCGSNSSANPGQITYLLTSGTPAGLVNTSNAAIAPCTANCMQLVALPTYAANNSDDTLTGWQNPPCSNLNPPGSFCAGGNGTPPSPPTQTINNNAQSLDGNSMLVTMVGQAGLPAGQTTNVLWPFKFGPNNAITHWVGIYHIYMPSVSNIQALELDQFQFNKGQRFMMGSECDSPTLAGGKWRIWNQLSGGGAWVNTTASCTLLTTGGAWHTIEWDTHRVAGDTSCTGGNPCMYYDALKVDGVNITPGGGFTPQPSAPSSDPDNNGYQVQLDVSSAGGTAQAYLDQLSLTMSTDAPSSDPFATSWNFGSSAGNGGNIQIGGGTGTVNTTNSAIGSCAANCVSWVSGNVFNSTWTKLNIAGVSYTVGTFYNPTLLSVTHTTGTQSAVGYSVVGTTYGVSVWNSTTVATLMSAPGTQTGVTYLNFTACKAGTSIDSGSGCQNSTTEDNTIPGHVSGSNIITRVSDGGTTYQGHSVGCLTISCGDNDRMFSHPNGTYIYVIASGGFVQPYQLDTSTHKVQVVNSGCVPASFNPGGVFATSWLTETTFYYMVAAQIWQGSISGTGCSIAFNSGSMLVDLMAAGVCSGVTPFTVQWRSSLTLSTNDDTFSVALSSAGQGTGDLEFAWSRTKGCSVANLNTGQVFCAAGWGGGCSGGLLGTMATGAGNCWGSVGGSSRGIHEALQSGDGNYVAITPTAPWNQGGCAGISGSAAGYAIWQLGTLGNQWCSNNASTSDNCGGHSSSGITHFISPSNYGYTLRSFSSVPSFTTFTDILPSADEHFAWPHNNNGIYDDTLPWVGNTDLVATAQLTGCTGGGAFVSAVYCPIWLGNVTEIIFPYVAYPPQKILTFTHTGACGYGSTSPQCADQIQDSFGPGNSIGTVSPKGDVWCWVSSIWHQTGWDYLGQPRSDVYCLYLGHP